MRVWVAITVEILYTRSRRRFYQNVGAWRWADGFVNPIAGLAGLYLIFPKFMDEYWVWLIWKQDNFKFRQ